MTTRQHHTTWSIEEAREQFEEIFERALADGPQHVTRNGRRVTVMAENPGTASGGSESGETALDMFKRIRRNTNEDLVFERRQDPPRHVDLGDE